MFGWLKRLIHGDPRKPPRLETVSHLRISRKVVGGMGPMVRMTIIIERDNAPDVELLPPPRTVTAAPPRKPRWLSPPRDRAFPDDGRDSKPPIEAVDIEAVPVPCAQQSTSEATLPGVEEYSYVDHLTSRRTPPGRKLDLTV